MKLVITDEARANLVQIADRIARDNPRRAISFLNEIEAHCRQISKTPFAYPALSGREAGGIRRTVHGNYLIFYRVEPRRVAVIHILHGARDYEALLFPDD